MGIVLFWISYLVSGLCLYTILRGMYIRKRIKINQYPYYKIEETNERYKLPLWLIIILIIVFFIPGLNICLGFWIWFSLLPDDREYYYKTFLTKKY